MHAWRNWAGNVECRPRHIETPSSEDDLVSLVCRTERAGGSLRVAGSGHSFTPLCSTEGTLVSLEGLSGVVEANRAACEATIWGGTTIARLGEPLLAAGLALENQGDIDYQALAGAISTGTHGTGLGFGSLSSCATELRLILASGEPVTCSATSEPDLFKAAQLSLGLLGVISQIRMRLLPAYRLHERTWIASFEETMEQLDELIGTNEHFEFFWLPEHDASAMKALNSTTAEPSGEEPAPPAPPGTLERYTHPERVDWSYRIYPSERIHQFVEMEFAVPLADGPDCFREIRQLIRTRHPWVTWAVEYRTQRADDLYLSPAYQRDSVTISVHERPDRPYRAYFDDCEAIFLNHGGRPHWGKLHSRTARDLRAHYPMWDRFQAVRERIDPRGRFLNPYLRRLMLDG
jgi:FAD/FMN-containing dehydrogenase